MESICRFIPAKNRSGSLRTVRFVLEKKFHTLKQPFYYPIHYLFLVISGTGTLRINANTYALQTGSLFFSFPQAFFEIDGSEDFAYIYISFMGDIVEDTLRELHVSETRAAFDGFAGLIDFWIDAVRRVTPANANLLTEGVLQYTLAMLMSGSCADSQDAEKEDRFSQIVSYIDDHYTEPELSLTRLADSFSYTPKYLSRVFISKMGIGFSKYLNNLRVQYACRLIEDGCCSVTQLSVSCGFTDPMYFSKVFKQYTGFPPQTFMKRCAEGK